jgi:hypothetical protein
MGKLIPFRPKQAELDKESLKLMKIADDIDAVILRYVAEDDISPRDIAGLLAHRLGTLMRNIPSAEREMLWVVCEKVLKEQAELRQTS